MTKLYKDTSDFYIKKRGLRELDAAVLNYYKNVLNIRITDQDGHSRRVPTFMKTAERSYLSDNPQLLDKNGTLQKPFMRIGRVGIDRTKGFYGYAGEAGQIRIAQALHSKTNNIKNLQKLRWGHNRKPPKNVVYEIYTIPFPDYFMAQYELEIESVYINQMNEILETIWQSLDWINMFKIPDYDAVDARKDFKEVPGGSFFYVGFQDVDVRDESNLDDYSEQERQIKQVISFRVGGVILGNTSNMPEAVAKEEGFVRMRKQYTAYKIKFPYKEESIFDPEEMDKYFPNQ